LGLVLTTAVAAGGTGYTTAPTVAFSAPNIPGGVQATGTATIAGGAVTGITITNPGSGYTSAPSYTLTGGGFTAAATPGASTVTVSTGSITLTEDTTMNLKSIATATNLTATSERNNIIDSTDATIVSATAPTIANSILVGGTATFSAATGSVLLGLPSNYNIIGITSAGNASVVDSLGNLIFTTTTVGGNLDILSSVANATVTQTGPIKAQGNTTITTTLGTIDLGNAANEFGGLRFSGGSSTGNFISITENTTMNLRGGSVANGPAVLNTNANFITSGTGGSSFISSLTINAPNGSIVPGAGSLLVVGTFTVFSNVLKDLSALSYSGNLASHHPVYLGTGTNIKPPDEP